MEPGSIGLNAIQRRVRRRGFAVQPLLCPACCSLLNCLKGRRSCCPGSTQVFSSEACRPVLQNVLVSTGDTVTVQQFQLPRASFEIALLTAEVGAEGCCMLPLAACLRGPPLFAAALCGLPLLAAAVCKTA